MGIPRVVIVGRPNVGKSSIFNWLAGRRIAIVDPTAGVTRDRMAYLLEVQDRYAELIDTGGMGVVDADNLADHIEEQITTAIDMADLLLFDVDARTGPAPLDDEVAKRLRYLTVPILCVANKADSWEWDPEADAFYRFGHKVLALSLIHI